MNEPLPPPGAEIEALLAAERQRPDPGADMNAAVWSRLGATLGLGAGGGEPGPSTGGGAGVGVGGATGLVSRSVVRTAATLLAGAAIGAGVHAAWVGRDAEKRPGITVPIPGESLQPSANPPSVEKPVFPPPPVEGPSQAPVAPATGPARGRTEKNGEGPSADGRGRDKGLAAERRLVEQAHTALSRGQGEAALRVLERHARLFPQGELLEERESLMIQVLVDLERYDQARMLGAQFHRRFPRSIFGAVVDESLRTIP